MTCMIVDDEPLAVRLLESYVARIPDLELLGSFSDSIEALDCLRTTQPDLLFLDIQMPDLNGMELAHAIDARRTRIVFTTAFRDYAFESYEVNALDYLLKPIRYAKFVASVDKARQLQPPAAPPQAEEPEPGTRPSEPPASTIFLRADGELVQVHLDEILYVEGMKDYLRVFFVKGGRSITTHVTMSAMEELLPESRFMRINRSYIIALEHIRSIDRNGCVNIPPDKTIRVTEAYREAFDHYVDSHCPGCRQS